MNQNLAVSIDDNLKRLIPGLTLGIVQAPVRVTKHDDALWDEINGRIKAVSLDLTLNNLPLMPQVKAVREGYKSLGKEASRYRGSAEALARRILQGKGLYEINTVVDLNNLVSLETLHPVGSYDLDRLTSPITFRIGAEGESYKGIGKETINIASLPVFVDANGPYGGPTSDSERAMISEGTKNLMLVIISFVGSEGLKEQISRAVQLLVSYAEAPSDQITTFIVE
jgi:DNA/RNA-binding domain of Phe-tRNA-synthetase-like protein